MTCIPGGPPHDHLLCRPPTKAEQRRVRVAMRRWRLDERSALEFVHLFYWEIETTPGGIEGLGR